MYLPSGIYEIINIFGIEKNSNNPNLIEISSNRINKNRSVSLWKEFSSCLKIIFKKISTIVQRYVFDQLKLI